MGSCDMCGAFKIIVLMLVLAFPTKGMADVLPRVVSMHHCMDQYVMELADPSQILSLSNASQSSSVSFHAAYAQKHQFRRNYGKAEEILILHPDVVFAGYYWGRAQEFLKAAGIKVETVYPPKSIDDVKGIIRRIAKNLHQVMRGQVLIQKIQGAETKAKQVAQIGENPMALIYYSGGYTQGRNTYFNDLLAYTGYRNAANQAGLKGPSVLTLEKMVLLKPDVVFEDQTSRQRADRVAITLMDHPALKRSIPELQRENLPFPVWLCGGEATVAALEMLQRSRVSFMEKSP